MKIQWHRGFVFCGILMLCDFGDSTSKAQIALVGVSDPRAIQDGTALGESLTLFHFNGPSGVITDLDIQLSIAHPNLLDLSIYLQSPAGTMIDLLDSVYGAPPPSAGGNLQDTRLDDSGIGAIGSPGFNTAPFAGPDWGGVIYQPEYVSMTAHQLSVFNGENAGGTWTLRVWDFFADNTGTLFGAGQSAPWGTAAGTKLLVTLAPVPEVEHYSLMMAGLMALWALGRVGRSHG